MKDKEHKMMKLKASLKHTRRDTGKIQSSSLGSFHLPKHNKVDKKVSQALGSSKFSFIEKGSSVALETHL